MQKVQFQHGFSPYFFVAPQILIILIFFIWPAIQAVHQSFLLEDAFGLSSEFVGLLNYEEIFSDPDYLGTVGYTLFFSATVAFLSMAIALLLAVQANSVIRGASSYKTLLMWAYAIAPPAAGLIGNLMFSPLIGDLYALLNESGIEFNHNQNGSDAIFVVVLIAVWKQVSINFIFFLSGLQGIPNSVTEASRIDCPGSFKRFWSITFPLLAPTTFFLLVINTTYAFFDTFGIIDVTTRGGPGSATNTLVYKVYTDGFLGADLGSSAAQSVILMVFVLTLTIFQFRFIEKKVHY
ncbi:glycerol-3-phosphate transporter permease [Endozoicomonas sp. OPT23]|uniref:sugar ABC transporter permease n=1 Tax=Endozoicomonas sp. OPT23 TaxID=2072845 RepID=UPI001DE7BD28|nr:glycerol-3-phosphate transporter permease [Endozoicomonas sp. OPT23]